MPYDYSLLLFFIVLLLILRDCRSRQASSRTAIICGTLSALGSLIYPGYYADAFIMTIFFVVSMRSNFMTMISNVLLYFLCFLGVVIGFEMISQMAGLSYLKQLCVLSSTVNHGSFSEGFLFIVRYIREVEGGIGMILFLSFFFYCFYFIFKDPTAFKWLLAAAILTFSLNAVLGIVFHKMVFYGRTLHMYFPFLVLATARAISLIPQKTWRKFLISVLILLSFLSFIRFAFTYTRLAYPRDVYLKYLSFMPSNKVFWIPSCGKGVTNIDKNYSAILLNFDSYPKICEGFIMPSLSPHMVLAVAQPHPLNFPAYTFENYSSHERKLIKKRRYQMCLYLDSSAYKIDH
jgi:hypothetical protein